MTNISGQNLSLHASQTLDFVIGTETFQNRKSFWWIHPKGIRLWHHDCLYTMMVWRIENTPTTLWVDNNLITCLQMCLGFLIGYLEGGYLPNYFLPMCNLFKKNTINAVKKVRDVLTHFKNHIPLSLLTIQDFKKAFQLYFVSNINTSQSNYESNEFRQLLCIKYTVCPYHVCKILWM